MFGRDPVITNVRRLKYNSNHSIKIEGTIMNRIPAVALVFAFFAASTGSALDNVGDAFLLRQRPSDENDISKLQFRDDSAVMLEIDALSVVGHDSTKLWTAIHESVADFITRTHAEQRIHIRFYHSDYRQTKPLLHQLHTEAKRVLADLPIYVVMIDETVRNDHKFWSDYRVTIAP
ncbi:hypothetical protein [Roseiconus lacunae]|uniref:DUF3574 domain-containing protein n=1 Tax=Roseiconus lacunae TaxID=2605694 RepID=A0ABT7PSB2_9BACT|nr:hypothetical protein [Roseiconus lacunae]MDM4019393.1 hypothetical protein [Roseiconus lacunae]